MKIEKNGSVKSGFIWSNEIFAGLSYTNDALDVHKSNLRNK